MSQVQILLTRPIDVFIGRHDLFDEMKRMALFLMLVICSVCYGERFVTPKQLYTTTYDEPMRVDGTYTQQYYADPIFVPDYQDPFARREGYCSLGHNPGDGDCDCWEWVPDHGGHGRGHGYWRHNSNADCHRRAPIGDIDVGIVIMFASLFGAYYLYLYNHK